MKLYIGNHRVMMKPAKTSGTATRNSERPRWRTKTMGQNHNVPNANHSGSNQRPGSGQGRSIMEPRTTMLWRTATPPSSQCSLSGDILPMRFMI